MLTWMAYEAMTVGLYPVEYVNPCAVAKSQPISPPAQWMPQSLDPF